MTTLLANRLLRGKSRQYFLVGERIRGRISPFLDLSATYPSTVVRWAGSSATSGSQKYPKSVLFNFYIDVKMKEDDMSKIEFEDQLLATTTSDSGTKSWWTTELYCPHSQKKFKSIEMKTSPFDNIEHKEENGLIYYPRRKEAHHAAAQAALNHLKTIYGEDLKPKVDLPSLKGFKKYASNPRSTLGIYFQRFHQIDIVTRSQFTDISIRGEDNCLWHHSTFTDPVGGESFGSGWLRDVSWGNQIIQDEEGRIYYPLRKLAHQAASGRFLDERLEEADHQLSPYCWDVPGDDSWKERATQEMEKLRQVEISKESQGNPDLEPHMFSPFDEDGDGDGEFEDEELFVTAIPSGLTAMDRVMEAWTEAVDPRAKNHLSKTTDTETQETYEGVPLLRSAEEERDQILQSSLQWWQSIQRNGSFRGVGTTQSVVAGILSSLAKANTMSPTYAIEALAKKIIESVEEPTVLSYNHYLMCLYGSNHRSLAKRAEKIVQKLARQGSKIVLEPNVETFETLIRLWARVGGEVAREKIAELVALMRSMEMDITRDIYLLVLAAMARQSADVVDFDAAKAKETVEEMQSMLGIGADSEMYNAPMYWSPEAPWDDHCSLFQQDIGDEETGSSENVAKAMQGWLREAEKLDVADIRTFEAVIQAWVRTGTTRGLAVADALALEVLEHAHNPKSNIKPRVQTFHPILAGHFYAGQTERLQEWCVRMSDLGFDSDSRIKGMAVAALHQAQKRHLAANNAKGARADARKGLKQLKQLAKDVSLFHEDSGPPVFLGADVVRFVIEATGVCKGEKSIEMMLDAVNILKDTVRKLKRVKNDAVEERPRTKQQLAHLAGSLASVFTTAISLMNQKTGRNVIAERSLEVEAMLRFVWENEVFGKAMNPVAYADGFSYGHPRHGSLIRDITELCSAVVDGCSRIAGSDPYSAGSIRLALTCFDLACFVDGPSESSGDSVKRTELHRRIVMLLGSIENDAERASLLTHVVKRIGRETSVDMRVINDTAASVLDTGKKKPVARPPWAKKRKQGRRLSMNKR